MLDTLAPMRAERFEATASGLRIAARSPAVLARRQRDRRQWRCGVTGGRQRTRTGARH